jgi:hypothetical protein
MAPDTQQDGEPLFGATAKRVGKKVGMGLGGLVLGLLSLKGGCSLAGWDINKGDIIDRVRMPPVMIVDKMGCDEYLVKVGRRKWVSMDAYLATIKDDYERDRMEARIQSAVDAHYEGQ